MSTVDFWASRTDAPGPRIAISNALSGPATAALFRLQDLVKQGHAAGHADMGSALATLTGAQLREVLRGLGDDQGAGGVIRQGHADEASLQEAIDDSGVYRARAVEV